MKCTAPSLSIGFVFGQQIFGLKHCKLNEWAVILQCRNQLWKWYQILSPIEIIEVNHFLNFNLSNGLSLMNTIATSTDET